MKQVVVLSHNPKNKKASRKGDLFLSGVLHFVLHGIQKRRIFISFSVVFALFLMGGCFMLSHFLSLIIAKYAQIKEKPLHFTVKVSGAGNGIRTHKENAAPLTGNGVL